MAGINTIWGPESRWRQGIQSAVWLCAVLLCAAISAPAQSCSLCYTQAASSGARMIEALRSGILVLIIPPMFMYAGITVMAYRKRNRFKQEEQTESDQSW